jgi:hypothetical protein
LQQDEHNGHTPNDHMEVKQGQQSARGSRITDDIDVTGLGAGLPINVREALRYRIRKKRMMTNLMLALGDLYQKIEPSKSIVDDLLWLGSPSSASGYDDKGGKYAKIRELVESKSRGQAKEQESVLTVAEKLSSKWLERGLNL